MVEMGAKEVVHYRTAIFGHYSAIIYIVTHTEDTPCSAKMKDLEKVAGYAIIK